MKRYDKIHEMSKSAKFVQDFERNMTEIGCMGGSERDSYIYVKGNYVLVAAYRPIDEKMVGTIMTKDVYAEMQQTYNSCSTILPMAYFAWTYGYGFNIEDARIEPHYLMKEPHKWQRFFEKAERMGDMTQITYLVTVCEDTLPEEEYGVQEDTCVIGITDDVRQAEYMIERYLTECGECNSREFSIKPIKVNQVLKPHEQVCIAAVRYIE